jgi:CRISPR-associated protein Cmx8
MTKPTEILSLEYDLHRLPTVQHRAGLGGLVFLLRALERDGKLSSDSFTISSTHLELKLSRDLLHALFNLLYADAEVTRTMNTKPKGDYEELEITGGDGKKIKKFAYKDRRPAGRWLTAVGYGADWLALWQDSIWSTLRDKPKSRDIYLKPVDKLVGEFWKDFEAVAKGKEVSRELASALYVGGRSRSNEDVSFDGPPEQILLLHFAHALAQPYKVIGLDSQGDRTYPGLAWVFPEPRDLNFFETDMRAYLGSRQENAEDGTTRVNFYNSTRVTMPQEAGLSMLATLEMALSATQTSAIAGAFCAQLDKQGNNVNLLAVAHLPARRSLIQQYTDIVAPISNYALKRLVLTNLLAGAPLSRGAANLMSLLPSEATIAEGKDGRAFSRNCQHLLSKLTPERTAHR